ncbi:MAG: hypothetical protein JNJ88_19245 [Planctomycetes bacterium]|nr:hypothetical protein [Planctomycetota bacterium]
MILLALLLQSAPALELDDILRAQRAAATQLRQGIVVCKFRSYLHTLGTKPYSTEGRLYFGFDGERLRVESALWGFQPGAAEPTLFESVEVVHESGAFQLQKSGAWEPFRPQDVRLVVDPRTLGRSWTSPQQGLAESLASLGFAPPEVRELHPGVLRLEASKQGDSIPPAQRASFVADLHRQKGFVFQRAVMLRENGQPFRQIAISDWAESRDSWLPVRATQKSFTSSGQSLSELDMALRWSGVNAAPVNVDWFSKENRATSGEPLKWSFGDLDQLAAVAGPLTLDPASGASHGPEPTVRILKSAAALLGVASLLGLFIILLVRRSKARH